MVKSEGEHSTRFEDSMGFLPAARQKPLVECVRIFWVSRATCHGLEGFWSIFSCENFRIAFLEDQSQPNVEEVGEFRVVE